MRIYILHGDVKLTSILLGDGWVVKVPGFGCLMIHNSTQVVPKGAMGYLDPEFLYDFQLTKLNDIYSFGVLLVELLTGKKPLVKERKNLTAMLHESLGNCTLDESLDTDIVGEDSMG
ncbi:wall-associated receptor kinase-like 10 [Panicum miliaceum]|uniref:Wall-associated receptor kinase-like 10 n=1 Tax=Panicum miliaceum TaxID=4540 RepID=A0A3L6SYI8_PANMI|nr:wall-associated receptor kinase-like 10 [Panicum miliaceum]